VTGHQILLDRETQEMRQTKNTACMGEIKTAYKILVEKT
jgi:hypothetical protein